MRITGHLIKSRAKDVRIEELEHLDLSDLGIAVIESLKLCPRVNTLLLCGNHLEAVENIDICRELWHVNFSCNRIQRLDGLRHFAALGSLALTHNFLDWPELAKLRHLHLVNLHLQGNRKLDGDANYRLHVVDCLPNVWMLDGLIVTAAERERGRKFFANQESSTVVRPVRHKIPPLRFVPTQMKEVMVTGVFGEKAKEMMSQVPLKVPHTLEVDRRRLAYIAQQFNAELRVDYVAGEKQLDMSSLLDYYPSHSDPGHMLLLLLVVSLEFSLPARLIEDALDTTQLATFGGVPWMQLFFLPKTLRCRVCGLLLSIATIERDGRQKDGLYLELYNALRACVTDLFRISLSKTDEYYVSGTPTGCTAEQMAACQCLLASEAVQIFTIVPTYFEFLGHDSGVLELTSVATREPMLQHHLSSLYDDIRRHKLQRWDVYQRIAAYILDRVKLQVGGVSSNRPAGLTTRLKGSLSLQENVKRKQRRPLSTPLVRSHKGTRNLSAHTRRLAASSENVKQQKTPGVGDFVLIQNSPRTLARIITITDGRRALLQIHETAAQRNIAKHTHQDYMLADVHQLLFDNLGQYWTTPSAAGWSENTPAQKWTAKSATVVRSRSAHSSWAPLTGKRRVQMSSSPDAPPSSPRFNRTSHDEMIDGDSDSDTTGMLTPGSGASTPRVGIDGTIQKKQSEHSEPGNTSQADEKAALASHVKQVVQHMKETGLTGVGLPSTTPSLSPPSSQQADADMAKADSSKRNRGMNETMRLKTVPISTHKTSKDSVLAGQSSAQLAWNESSRKGAPLSVLLHDTSEGMGFPTHPNVSSLGQPPWWAMNARQGLLQVSGSRPSPLIRRVSSHSATSQRGHHNQFASNPDLSHANYQSMSRSSLHSSVLVTQTLQSSLQTPPVVSRSSFDSVGNSHRSPWRARLQFQPSVRPLGSVPSLDK